MNSSIKKKGLTKKSVNKNPFVQFDKWYSEANTLLKENASAMTLSTVSNNKPSSRIVYLRGKDKKGFWFFQPFFFMNKRPPGGIVYVDIFQIFVCINGRSKEVLKNKRVKFFSIFLD